MIRDVMSDADDRMAKTVEALRNDLMSIRTGRATPALVEHLMVDYYNTPTSLQQLATISVPDAQSLVIRPFAANDIGAIEKAIAKSDLGLTPNSDGQQIRLTIPPLTEERRRDLTKVVGKRAEEARISVRNIRRDNIHDLREMEKESMISEDELRRAQEQIQEKTNQFITQVDQVTADKESEIMTL